MCVTSWRGCSRYLSRIPQNANFQSTPQMSRQNICSVFCAFYSKVYLREVFSIFWIFGLIMKLEKFIKSSWNSEIRLKLWNSVRNFDILKFDQNHEKSREQKFSITHRSLLLHVEVLTMTPNKTSTLGNKLLLWCINFYVEVSIGQKFCLSAGQPCATVN